MWNRSSIANQGVLNCVAIINMLHLINAPHIKLYKPLTFLLIYSFKRALACCWSLTPARPGSTHAVSQTQPKSTRAVCSAGQNVSVITKSLTRTPTLLSSTPASVSDYTTVITTLFLLPFSSEPQPGVTSRAKRILRSRTCFTALEEQTRCDLD